MKHQTPKTKELQDAVIAKVKQRLDDAKLGKKVDLVKLKKQLIASITANNEKKTIKLLGDIQKSVSNKDLVTVMKEVKASVEANKFTFPKYIEIIQTARPKWYKDPVETVKINGPIELKNAVKIEGVVKTEADAGTWTALAAVLGVVMEGLFSFLNKFSQKVFRVMPSKEHYTTPQLVVLADSKTGRPVDLKDIGSNHEGKVVVVGQGSRGGGSNVENVGPSEILKATIDLTASDIILAPTSGQKLRIYAIKFSLSADMSSASFNFGENAAFEKYLNPKVGGLYGTNVAPNYFQGGVDEELKLILSGTGTVTINIDYKIVS